MIRVLSLGAGVQSSTLALMAAHGEIERPDVAIFADTQSEPASVYRWLDFLRGVLPFPVVTVTAGSLRNEILGCSRGENRNDARPPFFVRNSNGSRGILRRQCTGDYKIDPIQREVRRLVGLNPGERGPKSVAVQQLIGISLDEKQRMKVSGKAYIENHYPLVDARINRHECIRWLNSKGYPTPPKSACTFCPYRRDHEWRRLRDEEPEAFEDACLVDEAIRQPGYCGLVGERYVHDSMVPLREVDFSTAEDRGQVDWINGMANECDGMCGV